MAGIIEVAGPVGICRPALALAYGFNAIIVAFLGRLNRLDYTSEFPRTHLHRRRAGPDCHDNPVGLHKVFQAFLRFSASPAIPSFVSVPTHFRVTKGVKWAH